MASDTPLVDGLPEPLSADPLPLFASWFKDARERRTQPNPDAMVLATVDSAGNPAARVVLCKRLVADAGYVVFFTNYESRKSRELSGSPEATRIRHTSAMAARPHFISAEPRPYNTPSSTRGGGCSTGIVSV